MASVSASSGSRIEDRPLVGAVSLAVTVVGMGLLAGLPGVVGGGVVAIVWVRLPTEYVVATGQIAIGALLPAAPSLPGVVVAELGLGGFVLASAVPSDRPLPGLASYLAGIGVLGGAVWVVHSRAADLWVSGLLVLGLASFVIYAIHRYERVRLGLVEAGGPE